MEAETLVVGASSAGMAVARQLQERGKPYLLVDREASAGRMWRTAYERLHLHTQRSRSGLPFQPMPASYPRYPSRKQVVAYLEDYLRDLKQQPMFDCSVTAIRRDSQRWVAQLGEDSIRAHNVVIATGNTRVPVSPTFEGAGSFTGSGKLIKNGTGTLIISNTNGNSFGGGITVNGGDPTASDTVIINGTTATDAIAFNPTTADGGTVQINGGL